MLAHSLDQQLLFSYLPNQTSSWNFHELLDLFSEIKKNYSISKSTVATENKTKIKINSN